MRHSDVRAAVRSRLEAVYAGDRDTRIVDEMGIWSGSARIDIAVINGELTGFELKSARDTLDRLDRQSELYNQVFDRVTLVAAERHLDRVLEKIPDWWGVTVATQSDHVLTLRDIRLPSRNDGLDALQIARLLWRPEALALLERHGLDKGVRSKPVDTLAARLASELPLDILCGEVRKALKSREGWLRQAVGD